MFYVLKRRGSRKRIASNHVELVGMKHDALERVVIVQVRYCTLKHVE